MTMRSGNRSAMPSRVIHGSSKNAPKRLEGAPVAAAPERGLPGPIVALQGQLKALERRVELLEKRSAK